MFCVCWCAVLLALLVNKLIPWSLHLSFEWRFRRLKVTNTITVHCPMRVVVFSAESHIIYKIQSFTTQHDVAFYAFVAPSKAFDYGHQCCDQGHQFCDQVINIAIKVINVAFRVINVTLLTCIVCAMSSPLPIAVRRDYMYIASSRKRHILDRCYS